MTRIQQIKHFGDQEATAATPHLQLLEQHLLQLAVAAVVAKVQ
jgi:hypothetical protein